jgi:hypothetical protein
MLAAIRPAAVAAVCPQSKATGTSEGWPGHSPTKTIAAELFRYRNEHITIDVLTMIKAGATFRRAWSRVSFAASNSITRMIASPR